MLNSKNKNRYTSTTYKLSITNTIGISIIDSTPRELLHITITNLSFTQSNLNEAVEHGENEGSHIAELQGTSQWERKTVFIFEKSISFFLGFIHYRFNHNK